MFRHKSAHAHTIRHTPTHSYTPTHNFSHLKNSQIFTMTHSHIYSSKKKKKKKNPVVHISSNSLYKWQPEQELAAGGTSTVCECQSALPASLSGPPWQRPPATCLWACSTSPCSPGGHASVPAPSCPASCRWQHRQAILITMIYFTKHLICRFQQLLVLYKEVRYQV